MEESINQRLKKFINDQTINEAETYKYLGARRQAWYGWLNSEEAIPLAKIQRIIARFPNLDARWLLTGDGNMLVSETKTHVTLRENDTVQKVEDAGSCSQCQEKDRLIMKLQNDLIESQKETIAALKGEHKKETPSTSGKKAV